MNNIETARLTIIAMEHPKLGSPHAGQRKYQCDFLVYDGARCGLSKQKERSLGPFLLVLSHDQVCIWNYNYIVFVPII